MLNFFALEPGEFAELSRDILHRATGKQFFLTDGPHDEGADFADDIHCPTIVGQAKRYLLSPPDKLMRALEREREKLKWLRPEEYYLFLARDLTRRRLEEIIAKFQPLTKFGPEHIFTPSRMDVLLREDGRYRDILNRYPKLWTFSADILSRELHKNVDFDTREMLLDADACAEFVPTESYCACAELLEREHAALLQGGPGTGKSTISRRLALELAQQGFRVRYTTDGDMRDIKALLSDDDTPELILLDDFLGQMYMTLDFGRARELEALLNFVRRRGNKRLLLNSRVTILQEAESGETPFSRLLRRVGRVGTDELTEYERARILRSHLNVRCADRPEITRYIASEKRYWAIIRHKNFNPRIIGMMADVAAESREPKEVYDRLLALLDDPNNIWAREFERNLQPADRVLLTTLYSLTNTELEFTLLETCYAARLRAMPDIDKTVNQLEHALARLNRSMLRQTWGETRKVSVLNPSVNDFLNRYIQAHALEREAIVSSAVCFEQIYKVLHQNPIQDIAAAPALLALVEQRFEAHSLLELRFLEPGYLGNILAFLAVIRRPLLDDIYRDRLLELLRSGQISRIRPFSLGDSLRYLGPLFAQPLFSYYQMERRLADNEFVEGLIKLADYSSGELFQVLSLIWSVLSAPEAKYSYDLDFFRQTAVAYAEDVLLNELADFEDFFVKAYDNREFNRLRWDLPVDMPPEDIIDYFEDDLCSFLEDDLTNQFVGYVLGGIRDALEKQPWFEGEISVDRDEVLIDQNIWDEAERMIQNALCDALPEREYDAYTARRMEASDNLRMERSLFRERFSEEEKEEAQIRALFADGSA